VKARVGESKLKSRVKDEIRRYLLVSSYLFICFSVILMYDSSLSGSSESLLLSLGVALGKALVVGKFILIGEVLNAGIRLNAPTLIHRIVWRTAGMLVVLIVLKLVEEGILGLAHGQGFQMLFSEILREPWIKLLAPVLLMLLILVPLMAATELVRALGAPVVKDLLLGNPVHPSEADREK